MDMQAQQQSARITTTPTSTQQQEITSAVPALMKQMRDRYPNQTITEGTAKIWIALWMKDIRTYGLPAFQTRSHGRRLFRRHALRMLHSVAA